MPKKKSVKLCTQRFREDQEDLLHFCTESEKVLNDRHISLVYDTAIIKLYAAFECMILHALTGAINNNTSVLNETTFIEFPKHLTDEVCEYIITGSGYFDFRGRDGLIREIRKYVPRDHYLVEAIKEKAYGKSLNQLFALRNLAAHESRVSKRAALQSIGQQRVKSAGSWLKLQNRLQGIVDDLSDLSRRIEHDAPY